MEEKKFEPGFMKRIQQRVEAIHKQRKQAGLDFHKARDALVKANIKPWNVDWYYEVSDFSSLDKVFEDSRTYQKKLQKHGFEVIGSGAHSSVYARKGSDRVLKVNYVNDNWPDFAKWAIDKGYAGTFAPKIYSLKQHKRFYVCSMERLDKTMQAAGRKHPLAPAVDVFNFACHANDNAKAILDLLVPGMDKFGEDLTAEFKTDLDIHAGNFMLRKDGSLVAVDPVYGRSSGKTYRIKNAA